MNILITGGASGLGEVITRRLAAEPANRVHFTYNNSLEKAERLQEQLGNTKAIKCDFKDLSTLDNLIAQMPKFDLDVLVNNAITSITKKHFHKIDTSIFSESFQNNIIPTIKITQQAITIFRKKKFGKIINILSSALIDRPPTGWSEYVANKAYLASLSKSWAVENASFNVTSNSISPALMQTELNSDIDERIFEEMVESHPLKRLLTPNEVADAVLFLIQASSQINGINLVINSAAHVI